MSQLNTSTPNSIKAPPVPTPTRSAYTIRQILVERFPACFRPKRTAKLPIKIGIHKDIRRAGPDLTAREIARALADYIRARPISAGSSKAPRASTLMASPPVR